MDPLHLVEAALKSGRSAVLWGFGYGRQLRDAWEAGKAGDPGADYYASRLGRAEDGGEALEPRSAHLGPYTAEEVFALRDDAWDHRPPPCGKHYPVDCDCILPHFHAPDPRPCWCERSAAPVGAPTPKTPVGVEPSPEAPLTGERSDFSKGVDAAANIIGQAAQKQWCEVLDSPLVRPMADLMDVARLLDNLTQELRDHANEYAEEKS